MKTIRFMVLLACIVAPGYASAAAVPNLLSWQGVALDESDAPLASGVYSFRFAIYDEPAGGNLMWEEIQSVNVVNGLVNVLIGSVVALPDTTFDGPDRFLEVQFEAEVPYAPRTKIVSVGYAFRVLTIDGASGGTLVGESGSIVEIGESTAGGRFNVFDESDQPVVSAGADADGEGGNVIIFSDPTLATGMTLDGNSVGTGDPSLSVLGSVSGFEVNGGLPGDQAVSLPQNSVAAAEILDEPGLAMGVLDGAVTGIVGTYVDLASATVTFPSDGYALIIVETAFRAHEGNTWIDGALVDNGQVVDTWFWDPGDPDKWFDQTQIHLHAVQVTGGTHTYLLRVRTSAGTVDAQNARVLAFYYPTAYGTVDVPASVGLSTRTADGEQIEPIIADPIDIDGDRADAIAANQARIETELESMRIQMESLKVQLREAKAWIEQERE